MAEEKETAEGQEEPKAAAKKSPTRRNKKSSPAASKATKPEPKAEPEPEKESFEILVRMTRRNPKFEVVGKSGKRYLFTQQHPYQIVTVKEDAETLLAVDGIELGSPEQVERFYS